MKSTFAVVALVAGTLAAPAPTLAATRHHHYRHVVPSYGYDNPRYGYSVAPYGTYAGPYTSSRYGTYPSWTSDPDPNMRAQLRSEFNRGVELPGNGR